MALAILKAPDSAGVFQIAITEELNLLSACFDARCCFFWPWEEMYGGIIKGAGSGSSQ